MSGGQFQVSVSSLALGTLYEAIVDFSSQESFGDFWHSICKNARWIFPSRGICVLSRDGDELVVEGAFKSGKLTAPETRIATPAHSKVGVALADRPTNWLDASDAVFEEDDPVAEWLRGDGSPTVLSLAINAQQDKLGALVFCMGEVAPNDRTMLTALGTVYAVHIGMAHKLIVMTEARREADRRFRDAQKQLVEAEKMASLGALVAGIAHEINTPVGIGVTAASHLQQQLQEFISLYKAGQMKRSDLNKFLETANESGALVMSNLQRAGEIIRSFKQVAVDQSSEERRSFALGAYLEEILRSLHPRLKKTKHEVVVRCAEDITLDSFPGALAQIVTNLVMNSLVHAFDKDDAGTMTFEATQRGTDVVVTYSDDGKGIAQDELGNVFDPFYTTKRGEGGSGLGLHITYNLVTQRLGGSIEIDSAEGRGTSFTITLPEKATGGAA